jgi:hypothetical protein
MFSHFFGPRCRVAAWLLALWCWLALAQPAVGQYVVWQVEIKLIVADVQRTADGLAEAARLARGRLVNQEIEILVYPDREPELETTLKVPPEMLETALARLRGMALEVLSEELQSNDVSSQVNELNDRLTQLRASRRRLQELLERAESDEERRQVETALSGSKDEINEAEAGLSALRQQVDWVAIHILARQAPPTPTPTSTPAPTLRAEPQDEARTPRPSAIPVTPSPTPWNPGKTVGQATDTLVWLFQHSIDLLIVVTVVWGPFIFLALGLWWFGRRAIKRNQGS